MKITVYSDAACEVCATPARTKAYEADSIDTTPSGGLLIVQNGKTVAAYGRGSWVKAEKEGQRENHE